MPLKRVNFPAHLIEINKNMPAVPGKAHFVTAITAHAPGRRHGWLVDRYRSVRFSRSTFLRNDLEPRVCGASFYQASASRLWAPSRWSTWLTMPIACLWPQPLGFARFAGCVRLGQQAGGFP